MKQVKFAQTAKVFLLSRSILLVLLSVIIFQSSQIAVFATEPLSKADKLAIFDDVWQTIRDRYYDSRLRGIDWTAQRATFRRRAGESQTSAELYSIMRLMVSELRDSHTRIFAPDEKLDWRNPRIITIGIFVREIENELVVINVEKGSTAEKFGIQIGDTITKIDGVPSDSAFAQKIYEQKGSSTVAAGHLKAAATLYDAKEKTFVNVTRRDEKNVERFASLPRQYKTYPPSLRVRRENATLIIAFDSFTNDIVREFYDALNSNLRGVRAIVLDLRGNRGGSTDAMTDLTSAFLPVGSEIGKFIDRRGKIAVDAQTRRQIFYSSKPIDVSQLPVTILTSTATASAAEIFTSTLKRNNRAKVIGTTTCGCVLAIRRQHSLPDGGVLEISELNYQTENGKSLEGVGVSPDEIVLPNKTDLRNRRDRTLERAFETMKNRTSGYNKGKS
ncbi:MAG: PDZ domain-containing protein [Pyrinomonadaceae bacterium]|nr:PDZ domain-containing protein [Pyrinomonadaceae bacterium]